MEKHGGICDCQSSRDTFIYASSADRRGIETVTRVLAEAVLRPKLEESEIDFARQAVLFELETLNMRPEQEPILMDRIHAAAYRGNTLGLPKLCPQENTDKIDRDVLLSFLRLHHTPSRMVVAGVGVDHDELVKYVEKYFSMESTWDLETLKNTSINTVDTSVAQYTGGEIKVNRKNPNIFRLFSESFCSIVICYFFTGRMWDPNLCSGRFARAGTRCHRFGGNITSRSRLCCIVCAQPDDGRRWIIFG